MISDTDFSTHNAGVQGLELSPLLELLPFAALVYNRSVDTVITANGRFLELSAYSLPELNNVPLHFLIPSPLDTNPTGDDYRPVRLKIASGDLILADLRVHSLSLTNQMVVLTFSPPEQEASIRQDLIDHELFFDNFSLLAALSSQTTLTDALGCAGGILQKLLNPQEIAVYLASSGAELNQLPLTASLGENQLPASLHTEQIPELSQIDLWKSSKKPSGSLEELALVKGYHYLVSIPLTFAGTLEGLLVACAYNPPPNDESMRFLKLLSTHSAGTVHQLNGLNSAQTKLQMVRQVIQIHHTITDSLEEGIIILTPELKIAEMNPAAENMLGYASRDVFRQPVDMVLIGNENLSPLYKSGQQSISALSSPSLSLNTRSGKAFPAQVLSYPVVADDAVISIVLIIRNLSQTEQYRIRSQQLEQRAVLGEVSAIFAHEVKNPINSIMAGLQLIEMNWKPTDSQRELLGRLKNECVRLTHLMDSTLTFSKPTEFHFTKVDLSAMIPDILERWAPRMSRLNIHRNFETVAEHTLVHADERAIEQVLVNLISNAISAMEASGGTLSIRIANADAQAENTQYEVIVADSGTGIPDDVKDHIFEPFVTTSSSGTGLGLAISKRIISAHKGNIFVESYPGGTMFHVLLPKA